MSWEKIADAPHWLEIRQGRRKISYRVNYRAEGIHLVKTLTGSFPAWRKAKTAGEDMIAKARLAGTPDDPMIVRCDELLDELIRIAESRAEKTYEQVEATARLHLKPWLNANCPYAKDLNGAVWLNYRSFKRRQNPNVTLKVHYEQFAKLCRYAREKGIIKSKFKLDYDRERDDFAEEGMVISKEDLIKMLKAKPEEKRTANGKFPYTYQAELEYFEAWRDRIIIQRATGMRPGEVRNLRKDRVTIVGDRAVIRLKKEDTKTRQARPVPVKHKLAVEILKLRMEGDSAFLFPSKTDRTKPMGESSKGWRALIKRAGVNPKYTPHDLRHTFLSDMFRNSNNPALICFTCGLSLDEAQKTYLHFTEDDAFLVGNEAATRLSFMGVR